MESAFWFVALTSLVGVVAVVVNRTVAARDIAALLTSLIATTLVHAIAFLVDGGASALLLVSVVVVGACTWGVGRVVGIWVKPAGSSDSVSTGLQR